MFPGEVKAVYLLLFGLWLALNGRITAEICLLGIAIVGIVGVLAYFLFGYTPKRDLRFLVRVPLFLIYAPVLIFEIMKASFRVIGIIWNTNRLVTPALVIVETGLRSRFAQFVLANSITLTPGTITVRTNGGRFTVHCLSREMSDGIEDGLLCRLLKRMEA